jgi:FkbH-like protein
VLRHAFDIDPGANFHTLDAGSFTLPGSTDNGLPRLLVYPENDEEARVVFTWLDFVSYSNGRRPVSAAPTAAPAEKVKCVAWDLDNTLWSGILVEDGAGACRPRAEVLETVRALDDRGILQTVVSKNDHDVTWELVERLGLSEYFLYPAINWGSKSQNLRQVAERLNIGLDTFALVDDSPFERAEVETALPMVRTYSDSDAVALLERPEFDVVVTEASRRRRQSYLENIERDRVFARFAGDYLDFLRSCEMTMRIFAPVDEGDRRRCLELVQRSNQLNLSSRRYAEAEFAALLEDPDVVCLAVECADRFGSYGIVGFASMTDGDSSVRVGDLVLSCRVARKRVEHSFFRWLGARVLERGGSEIRADFRPTERNAPLAEVLADLRFAVGADGTYTLSAAEAAAAVEVNVVRDEVMASPLG